MQQLILVGRATQDSELLKTKKDSSFAVFTLAANRYVGKDKDEETTFYDCICFLKNAEKLVEKVKKGDKVFVKGRPEATAYINKDKAPVAQLKVVVESWESIK